MSPSSSTKQTRSEQIRNRRQVQSTPKKSLKKQPTMPIKPTSLQKVTTRRTAPTSSTKTGYQYNANRRKVYVPLKTPGAEISLPAFPDFKIGWRLSSFLIAIISLVAVIGLKNSSIFRINQVDLIGAIRVPPEEVLAKINVANLSIVEIQPRDLESQVLSTFHDLKSARVSVGLPAAITMDVVERVPAVLWDMEDVDEFWIDEEGYRFPVRGEASLPVYVKAEDFPPAPLTVDLEVTNLIDDLLDKTQPEEINPDVDPEFVTAVLSLKSMMPTDSTLLYSSRYGLGWQDTRGWKVYFGTNTAHIDQKLAQYSVIIEELQARKIQPVLISLEFLRAPFYRLEN